MSVDVPSTMETSGPEVMSFNAILLTPIGLALTAMPTLADRETADSIFYWFAQLPRYFRQAYQNFSDFNHENAKYDSHPTVDSTSAVVGINEMDSSITGNFSNSLDSSASAADAIYEAMDLIRTGDKGLSENVGLFTIGSSMTQSEIYGFNEKTYLRTLVYTMLDIFKDAFDSAGSHAYPYIETSMEGSSFISSEGSVSVSDSEIESVTTRAFINPLALQAFTRAILYLNSAGTVTLERFAVDSVGTTTWEESPTYGFTGPYSEEGMFYSFLEILMKPSVDLANESWVLFNQTLGLFGFGEHCLDMGTMLNSAWSGSQPYLLYTNAIKADWASATTISPQSVWSDQMSFRKFYTHCSAEYGVDEREVLNALDADTSSIDYTFSDSLANNVLPTPVGQADNFYTYSLMRRFLQEGDVPYASPNIAGMDVTRGADFIDADIDMGKKIIAIGLPVGLIDNLKEDAIQSATSLEALEIERLKTIKIDVYKYDLERYDVVYRTPQSFLFDTGLFFASIVPEVDLASSVGTDVSPMNNTTTAYLTGNPGTQYHSGGGPYDSITPIPLHIYNSTNNIPTALWGLDSEGTHIGWVMGDTKWSCQDYMDAVENFESHIGAFGDSTSTSSMINDTDSDGIARMLPMIHNQQGEEAFYNWTLSGTATGSNWVFWDGHGFNPSIASRSDNLAAYIGNTSMTEDNMLEASLNCIKDNVLKTYVKYTSGVNLDEDGFPLFASLESLMRPGEVSDTQGANLLYSSGHWSTGGRDGIEQTSAMHACMKPSLNVSENHKSNIYGDSSGDTADTKWAETYDALSDNHFYDSVSAANTKGAEDTNLADEGVTSGEIEDELNKLVNAIAATYVTEGEASTLTEPMLGMIREMSPISCAAYKNKCVLPKLFERTFCVLIDPNSFTAEEITVSADGLTYEYESLGGSYESKIYGFYVTVELLNR